MKTCKFALILVLLSSTTMLGADKINKQAQNLKKSISECLKNGDSICLEKYVVKKIYFPEQADFGCKTQDAKKNDATAKEFSKCTYGSKEPYVGCGAKNLILLDALKDCFVNAKAKYKDNYFSGSAFVCYLEKESDDLLFESIHCQP